MAPAIGALRLTERAVAGCQEVEDDAQGKKIATRIAAIAEHLLGRHISAGSDWAFRFFLD